MEHFKYKTNDWCVVENINAVDYEAGYEIIKKKKSENFLEEIDKSDTENNDNSSIKCGRFTVEKEKERVKERVKQLVNERVSQEFSAEQYFNIYRL